MHSGTILSGWLRHCMGPSANILSIYVNVVNYSKRNSTNTYNICILVLKKDGFGDSPSFRCIVAEEQNESMLCKVVCMLNISETYLLSFVESPRKFIIAELSIRNKE